MARQQGRNAYRRDLIAEFDALFPPPLFRGLPRHGNEEWSPRMILWVSVIMFWVSGKTLDEQFSAARRIVKFLRPRWNVPVSYSVLITNVLAPKILSDEDAREIYKSRWGIEEAFQTLTDVLRCEVETLGYPKAGLFAFAVAVLAYNTYAVAKSALRSAHGTETIDEKLSDYHLVHDVVVTEIGMEIAVEPVAWERYQSLSARQLAKELVRMAKHVKLSRYPKKKRGPKKPQPRKKSGERNHHIATARILAESRGI